MVRGVGRGQGRQGGSRQQGRVSGSSRQQGPGGRGQAGQQRPGRSVAGGGQAGGRGNDDWPGDTGNLPFPPTPTGSTTPGLFPLSRIISVRP